MPGEEVHASVNAEIAEYRRLIWMRKRAGWLG
jgi:hypothetical protein